MRLSLARLLNLAGFMLAALSQVPTSGHAQVQVGLAAGLLAPAESQVEGQLLGSDATGRSEQRQQAASIAGIRIGGWWSGHFGAEIMLARGSSNLQTTITGAEPWSVEQDALLWYLSARALVALTPRERDWHVAALAGATQIYRSGAAYEAFTIGDRRSWGGVVGMRITRRLGEHVKIDLTGEDQVYRYGTPFTDVSPSNHIQHDVLVVMGVSYGW